VEKADLVTTTATAAAQVMNATQASEFLSLGMEEAVLIKDSEIRPMVSSTEDINQITIDGLGSVIGATDEVTAVTAAQRAVPSFSRAQLDVREFLLQGRISRSWVESNIAKERGREQVPEEFAKAFVWGLENAAWRGDTSGSNPSGWGDNLGTTIDGWRGQATTTTDDHGGGVPNTLLFHSLLTTLPVKHRTGNWKDRYRFYCHPDLIEQFWYVVEARATNAGDRFLLKDGTLYFRGVAFVGAPCFQQDITGTGAASGLGANTQEVLLCEPQNKVVGYHRNIFVYKDTSEDGRIFYTTYSVRADVAFKDENKVVKATNVKNDVS
jgi:hypothetical protein